MADQSSSRRSGPAQGGDRPDDRSPLRIRLLGPVDVAVGDAALPLGSPQARTMLAVLAVRAGQGVGTDVLIDAVWGDGPPRTAAHALHVHASTLRQLAPGQLRIVGGRGSYRLDVVPGQLDVDQFEDLAARGRAELSSGRPDAAARLLRAALDLCRGPVLADVPWERFADAEARRWEELRHATQEDLADADLAAGRHTDVVAGIEALVADQPFREHRWGQLMVGLYRSGRQADALARYQEVRTLLREELGIEPSPQLRRLEAGILRHDPALASPVEVQAPGDLPTTRFARSGDSRLAYQMLGQGPVDLVFIPGFGGNVEIRWEQPNLSRLYRRLAGTARLVLFDRRGTGLSDRDAGIPPVDEQVDDVLAVMDAAGMARAALFGVADGGALALLTAATHPDRVDAVVTYAAFSAFELLGAGAARLLDTVRELAQGGLPLDEALTILAPSHVDDPAFIRWMGRYVRFSLGMDGSARLVDNFRRLDVRPALPQVTVPVLALHRRDDRVIPAGNADHIASHLRHGRAVVLPGADSAIWAGDVDAIASQVEAFLRRSGPRRWPTP